MMRIILLLGLWLLLMIGFKDGAVFAADDVSREMKVAGFWIQQHPSPDALVMPKDEISKFNKKVRDELKLTKDIFSVTQNLQTDFLAAHLEATLTGFEGKGYFSKDGIRDDKVFLDKMRRNVYLTGVVSGMEPRYGLVLRFTNQRLLPTDDGLYAQKDDWGFDELQNSGLDIGTPVALVHKSADGQWYYVFSEISDGWVKAQDIALGSLEEVRFFAHREDFAVVVKPKASIFLDEGMKEYLDYGRMGMRLPLAGMDEGKAKVHVPILGKDGKLQIKEAFMDEADIHPGFLPYTARHILNQAFAMLNMPYGWGDMQGEQDCSRFLQMVFATVGVSLPRDSKNQAQVGKIAVQFDEKTPSDQKIAALASVKGAESILPLKGHIMLYLGSLKGVPYVIHETSGYKQRVNDKDVHRPLNRVVVSDLSLGDGTLKGSLLKRLLKIVEIVPYE